MMLRLPTRVLDPADVAGYCVGDSAFAWTSGKNVIIRLNREDEDGIDEWDIDGHGLLASIIPVRAGLAAGDLRLLYLGWLRCAQSQELADDEPEPPVPTGLGALDPPLTAIAGFLCIDRDLVAAAAAGSPPATTDEPTAARLRAWVLRLPTREEDTILTNLIAGDDRHLRNSCYADTASAFHGRLHTTDPRTAGDLLAAAAEVCAERERRDAEQRERDRARQER
jgi:hypothetical protein